MLYNQYEVVFLLQATVARGLTRSFTMLKTHETAFRERFNFCIIRVQTSHGLHNQWNLY